MMSGNSNLNNARKAKQDEFYTQLTDIEKELRYYEEHFEGKTILCNCDDPFESNFFKYFVLNFNRLGIKKLITTCFTGSPITNQQLSLFNIENDRNYSRNYNQKYAKSYKAVITKVQSPIDNTITVAELFKTHENELVELTDNGDFRSEECVELLNEADIVVTNPPFSLFREYVNLLIEKDKKFLILGSLNGITYRDIFPLFMNNKMWLGNTTGTMTFEVPEHYTLRNVEPSTKNGPEKQWRSLGNVCWFTNMGIKKRNKELPLFKKYAPDEYPMYDNYDAINVDKVKDIPCDYPGAMGVPIAFMEKYNPEQFEIVGITSSWFGIATKKYPKQTQISSTGTKSSVTKLNDGAAIKLNPPRSSKTYYEVDNEFFMKLYSRILIRNKRPKLTQETDIYS